MKTAISIPDDLFEEADRLARRLDKSRSELYSHAVREYVAKYSPDHVTETLDALVEKIGDDSEFAVRAAHQILEHTEW